MTAITVNAGEPVANDPRFLRWLTNYGFDPKQSYKAIAYGFGQMLVYQYAIKNGKKYVVLEEVELLDPDLWKPVTGQVALRYPSKTRIKKRDLLRLLWWKLTVK